MLESENVEKRLGSLKNCGYCIMRLHVSVFIILSVTLFLGVSLELLIGKWVILWGILSEVDSRVTLVSFIKTSLQSS